MDTATKLGRVTSQEHVIKGSRLYVTLGYNHRGTGDMILICHVTSSDHVFYMVGSFS